MLKILSISLIVVLSSCEQSKPATRFMVYQGNQEQNNQQNTSLNVDQNKEITNQLNKSQNNQKFFSSELYKPESPNNIHNENMKIDKSEKKSEKKFYTEIVNLDEKNNNILKTKLKEREQKFENSCYLQVGLFSSDINSNKMIEKVKLTGLKSIKKKDQKGIRVLVGPFKNDLEFQKAKEKLASKNIDSYKFC